MPNPAARLMRNLRHLWVAPELGLLYHRRERRVRLLTSIMMMTMGLVWGAFFVSKQLWLVVGMDAMLFFFGLISLILTCLDRRQAANLVIFGSLLVIVIGNAVLLDPPNAQAPRSTHLYLLGLGVAALVAFRDDDPRLRYGVALLCLSTFVVLAATTADFVPGYALPDDIRVPGTWLQTLAATTMLTLLVNVLLTDATERSELEADLVLALVQHQLELHYQPQVDTSGRVLGAEALLRWRHPTRGLVMPGQFIDLAEQTGLIVPMGQWVLETACAQLQTWSTHPERSAWCLAVNISQRQFRQADFVPKLLDLLQHHHFSPSRLELELTETMLVEDIDDIKTKMLTLAGHGIRFSLDDFGTGYSSLNYLKRLPLNKLKIDQSFVADVLSEANSAAIVRMVLALGGTMNLQVIAEGVETAEQHAFLVDNGCQQFQGYLFSRPVPVRELEAWQGTEPPSWMGPQVSA